MHPPHKRAFVLATLAALLWSPHPYLLESLRQGGVPLLVAQFHFVFWPAVAFAIALFLSGRGPALLAFRGQETHVMALAAAGGYGFWVLRAVASEAVAGAPTRALLCAAPLLMAVLSILTSERPDRRVTLVLLAGLAGSVLLVVGQSRGTGVATHVVRGSLSAFGAAACWAAFSLLVRPLMREEDQALPVAALVTGIGAVCLFVSCLSTGENVLRISMPQLWGLIFAGLFTVGLVMLLWLKSIGSAPVTLAAPFWYLAPVLGVAWALVSGWRVSLWWTLSGVALVLLSLRTVLSGRQQTPLTLADVIRSSSG